MKKLLALLLSLMLMLSLTACGNKDKDADATTVATEEADVENDVVEEEKEPGQDVVEAFLGAIAEFNLAEALSYTDGADVALPFDDIDGIKDIMIEAMGEEVSDELKDSAINFIEVILLAYSNSIEYEIEGYEEDGDQLVYTVNATYADIESIDYDAIGEDYMTELMENGTITEDMSEEEMYIALFDAMAELFADTISTTDTKTEILTLVLNEADGKYIISQSDSDAGSFMDDISDIQDFSF